MYFLLHRWIPVILNGVVCSALQKLSDLSPFVTYHSVLQIEDPLLVLAPNYLLNLRIQMIVPSFSTLFSYSTRKWLSNQSPFLWSILVHKVKHKSVFLFSPRPFEEIRVKDFLPPVEALDIGSSWQLLGYLFPAFPSMFLDSSIESIILWNMKKRLLTSSVVQWPLLYNLAPCLKWFDSITNCCSWFLED